MYRLHDTQHSHASLHAGQLNAQGVTRRQHWCDLQCLYHHQEVDAMPAHNGAHPNRQGCQPAQHGTAQQQQVGLH